VIEREWHECNRFQESRLDGGSLGSAAADRGSGATAHAADLIRTDRADHDDQTMTIGTAQ
jgi:hypothetical protein